MALKIITSPAMPWLAKRADESVDLIYVDPPFFTQREFGEFDDRWADMDEYLRFLSPHLRESHRILKPTGNLILHLDWRASSYARVKGDSIFGADNFRNEIIWSYSSGGASKRHLSRKHDNLLWWSKTDKYTFNVQREPYATGDVAGRPGFHPEGRMMTDVWNISIISTTGKERCGYPTQKPLKLMSRIIETFSNPGDVVVDFFAGSGTTGVAAEALGRDAMLVDKNPEAVTATNERLVQSN